MSQTPVELSGTIGQILPMEGGLQPIVLTNVTSHTPATRVTNQCILMVAYGPSFSDSSYRSSVINFEVGKPVTAKGIYVGGTSTSSSVLHMMRAPNGWIRYAGKLYL